MPPFGNAGASRRPREAHDQNRGGGVGNVLRLVRYSVARARVVALFRAKGVRLVLVGAHSIDEAALTTVGKAWAHDRRRLVNGESVWVQPVEPRGVRYLVGPPPAQALIVPILGPDEGRLAGLLYADGDFLSNWNPGQVGEIESWRPLLARLLAAVRAGDGRARLADGERAELQAWLERQGWRPAEVARELGIGVAAVYARCRRLGITRDAVERSYLQRLFAELGGDLAKVAREVGVGRRAVVRRMVALGILGPRRRGRPPVMSAEELRASFAMNEWSLAATARSLGITPAALWNRRSRMGLKRPRRPPEH